MPEEKAGRGWVECLSQSDTWTVYVCVYVLVRPSLLSGLIHFYSPVLCQPGSAQKTNTNALETTIWLIGCREY